MSFRHLLASTALCAGLLVSAHAQAASLTGSFATWAAAVTGYQTISNTGVALYNPITSIVAADGAVLTLSDAGDTVAQPFDGWGPWSGGYTGDVVVKTLKTEVFTFATGLSALGMDLSPDLPFFGPFSETFTVTLSDGTTASYTNTFALGDTQFVGFLNGHNITSMTITSTVNADFAFGNIVEAPEPVSASLLVAGIAGLGLVRRRARG